MTRLPKMLLLARPALLQRFQHHEKASLVERSLSARKAGHRVHGGIRHYDAYVAPHLLGHRLERNILRSDYRALDAPRILLREEALWHDVIQIPAQDRDRDCYCERQELVAQHPSERICISSEQAIERPFAGSVENVVLLVLPRRGKELFAHGRRGRQRNHQRYRDRNAQGYREFAK